MQQCPKTTLRKQPSEKATFISFSGHKGGNYSARYSQGFVGSGSAPHNPRTEHDWESGTLTAETIDAGYISIILEI
ncbi:hypothetical protein J4732_11380 [Serratia marcescens]|uniref:Uncharacterized protein n=1 Tax=Serratia marcescens TaxID=615 RepID=A0A939NKZ1_SERMA|nr:hypothetical protein [Serratia marcescens]